MHLCFTHPTSSARHGATHRIAEWLIDAGAFMAERFQVRVSKDYLVFCSGHFISYEGDKCERLHGHNYRCAVEVEGELDENHYVFDFIALKNLARAVTD